MARQYVLTALVASTCCAGCLDMPHLGTAAVSLVAAVVYAAAALAMTAADFDPNPLSSGLMAAASSLPLVKVRGRGCTASCLLPGRSVWLMLERLP
jgi:hypothetical protein